MTYYVINIKGMWVATTKEPMNCPTNVYKTDNTGPEGLDSIFGLCCTYIWGAHVMTTYRFSCTPFKGTYGTGLRSYFKVPVNNILLG